MEKLVTEQAFGSDYGVNALAEQLADKNGYMNGKKGRPSSQKKIRLLNKVSTSVLKKDGRLLKKSPTLLVGFQNRSVEVGGHQLRYFKETKDRDVMQMGILNFDLYQCKV